MMGILYLVLLGLAATTVTDHVLDAFRNLTVSLETSTKNVQITVDNAIAAFEATKMKNEPERAKPVYERASKVKQYAAELNTYINEIKKLLYDNGGGVDYYTDPMGNFSNQITSTPSSISPQRGGASGDHLQGYLDWVIPYEGALHKVPYRRLQSMCQPGRWQDRQRCSHQSIW